MTEAARVAGVSDEVVDLRELRDARETARERVGAAYAEGLFDADELDRRMEAIEGADTVEAVKRVAADLGAFAGAAGA